MKKTTKPNGAAKAAETTKNESPRIAGLRVSFQFDARWKIGNTLLVDGRDRFYLAKVEKPGAGELDGLFVCDDEGQLKPLSQASTSELEPITPREALEWYADGLPYSRDSAGDLADLCRIAADALPETV